MMIRPLGLVPRRRQGSRRKLQGRIIGDIELPVGHQLRRAACRKSLSAITNRSAISRRLVLCVFSQPYWSQFSKLILVTDQENFGPFDNAGKKLVAFSKFTREFASAIDRRIHFSPQFSLYVRESVHDLRQRDAGSDNKNVNVARRIFVSRGHGAKYEGQCDPLRQPSQTIGNQLRRAKRLARQTTQFPVKRAFFIGLIVYLTAFDRPREYPRAGQSVQLSLHRPGAKPRGLDHLALVVTPFRPGEEYTKYRLPGRAEKRRSRAAILARSG